MRRSVVSYASGQSSVWSVRASAPQMQIRLTASYHPTDPRARLAEHLTDLSHLLMIRGRPANFGSGEPSRSRGPTTASPDGRGKRQQAEREVSCAEPEPRARHEQRRPKRHGLLSRHHERTVSRLILT